MKETVTRHEIKIQNSSLGAGGFRAAFISDMHNCIWQGSIEYMASLIEAEEPDLILCGGDMPVAHPSKSRENLDKALAFINRLAENTCVYYAFGNHEYRMKIYPETYKDMYEEYIDSLDAANVKILDNDSVTVYVNGVPVCIYGLSISRRYYQRFKQIALPVPYISKAIGQPKKDMVNILLAHHPRYISSYFKWGADIVLSGHYHGGVVQLGGSRGLISPDPCIFPHTAHGLIEYNGQSAVISAGMGEHTVPFRFNNPREIIIMDVEVW